MAGSVTFPSGRPYGGRSPEDRRADRRRKILDAALDLYSSTGYASTTITALCHRANVSAVKFYEEFATQEEVIGVICAEIVVGAMTDVAAAIEGVEPDTEAVARAGLTAYCEYLLSDPRRARVLYVEVVGISSAVEAVRHDAMRTFADLTVGMYETNARKNGGEPVERTPRVRLIARTLVGACTEGIVACMLDPDAFSVEQLVDVLVPFYVAADEVITGASYSAASKARKQAPKPAKKATPRKARA